jgi:tRNA(Ile)-lysidine synthase TilS/MesJ
MQRIIGVICLVVGILVLVWGHNLGQSVGGQLQNVFTGSPGDKAMHLYIGGTALGLFGLFLIFWKKA